IFRNESLSGRFDLVWRGVLQEFMHDVHWIAHMRYLRLEAGFLFRPELPGAGAPVGRPMRETRRTPASSDEPSREEVPDSVRDLPAVRLQREVSGLEEMDLGVRKVAP